MKGTVTAKSGSTVKLRQKPSTDCPIYWDIPVGTEMEIVDQRDNWSKCICGGLTGWMKSEFIQAESEEDDDTRDGGDGSVVPHSRDEQNRPPVPPPSSGGGKRHGS